MMWKDRLEGRVLEIMQKRGCDSRLWSMPGLEAKKMKVGFVKGRKKLNVVPENILSSLALSGKNDWQACCR